MPDRTSLWLCVSINSGDTPCHAHMAGEIELKEMPEGRWRATRPSVHIPQTHPSWNLLGASLKDIIPAVHIFFLLTTFLH